MAKRFVSVKRNMNLQHAVLLFDIIGLIGCHHYYLTNYGFGLIYTLTFGLLGIGWIWDWFRMPILVRRANKKIQEGDDG